MMRRMLPVLAALALPGAARSQSLDAAYDSAYWAWDAGRYVEGLERLERLLTAPGGDRFFERVALLTGELYHTTELAPDGRRVLWSRDGRYAAIEVVAPPVAAGGGGGRRGGGVPPTAGSGAPHALLFRREGAALAPAGEVAGHSLTFLGDGGRVAYLSRDSVPRVVVRDLAAGTDATWASGSLVLLTLADAGDGVRVVAAARTGGGPAPDVDLHEIGPDGIVTPLTNGPGVKLPLFAAGRGAYLVYSAGQGRFAVRARVTGTVRVFDGAAPAVSRDGATLVFLGADGRDNTLNVLSLDGLREPRVVKRTPFRLGAPAVSPDGRQVVFQMMPREDWELYLIGADGSGERRLTHEIQHDLLPRFLTGDRILATIGEQRHRRSYLYDVATGVRTRLFHNNTVRTVAPEYQWAESPDGAMVLIVADRDGDTVSPERGVYLVDLDRRIEPADLLARVREMLAAERALRARGTRTFAPLAAAVRAAVADVSAARIARYATDLYAFGSKHITRPGNGPAIEYLAAALRGFGYEPELQWFEPRSGVRTANVMATLRGTANPDLVYVVGSHFDSVEDGPGADDNTSGTTALLEAARVLSRRPQAATIRFVFFTGEEGGLLGSREFVRRAVADGVRLAGVLNNDMIGWMNDHRLDNTIRYSNDGIRDVQHAAAFLFTDLITYDSRYYQSTDAAAFYERYGDIVGGIGSYPILGNPHYHQSHDVLETIDHRLVAEVSKTTVATLMLLAASPARLAGLDARWTGRRVEVSWAPAPERGVSGYRVAYGPPEDPMRRVVTVRSPAAALADARAGWRVAVKAVLGSGLESWDWARTTVAPTTP